MDTAQTAVSVIFHLLKEEISTINVVSEPKKLKQ
jgi:hypothetical protein